MKGNKLLFTIVIIVCIAIVVFTAVASINKNDEQLMQSSEATIAETTKKAKKQSEKQTTDKTDESSAIPTTVEQITQKIEAASKSSTTGRIIVDPTQEAWNLVVVNAGREIPSGYVPELKEILGCGKYLDYRVAPHYEDMYYAAKKDGITLTPYSAYRSYERQERNYNNLTNQYMTQYNLSKADAAKKAATVILPPGTSEHNLGLAMDVCNTYDSFANSKEYAWLQKHAHEYGFILRYTKEKQPITGIVPEPWHWRYVGVEYAEKIKNSGLCLEEYLDSIGVAY
ncbi:MAG: M15 family metallopeptidase [Faecalibacterium sp.]|nr:M15 family metallopeptidase [Ruminococcus sp.]MCM1486625.1 M15 family metallopeptidase [Faecalibacterium sp.]